MADNFRVLDVSADELEEQLNAIAEPWLILHWDFYEKAGERRVTVVMIKVSPATVPLPPGFNPRILRRN